ncbi:PREDICTED: leucine-rich repeat-containing protein 69, partial [Galeopterus variegatus]|uniref:Leucine-rich repeat-containing protein 69 n=1 Tax=Galeopterus variegatus TaxID=482537 RepID=A0ABM0QD39_GALVR
AEPEQLRTFATGKDNRRPLLQWRQQWLKRRRRGTNMVVSAEPRLKSLTYLSINYNRLASIPIELCFLEDLSELQLNYNQLICIPEEIKFLKKLKTLFLVRNNIEVLPEGLCNLKKLRMLDIAGNIIQIFPPRFQNLKLREFYCEGNPLFLKRPVIAIQQEDVWSLKEIASRFVMNQLEEKNPFLMHAIERYPQVRNIISQGKKCVICGKSFCTMWLECVQFVPPSKNWLVSRNLELVPLRTLICSYKCFNRRGPNVFGIAEV